jgi:hypothetical protein
MNRPSTFKELKPELIKKIEKMPQRQRECIIDTTKE